MERQLVFHVLGIDETKDEQEIKNAYRSLLKTANPRPFVWQSSLRRKKRRRRRRLICGWTR